MGQNKEPNSCKNPKCEDFLLPVRVLGGCGGCGEALTRHVQTPSDLQLARFTAVSLGLKVEDPVLAALMSTFQVDPEKKQLALGVYFEFQQRLDEIRTRALQQ